MTAGSLSTGYRSLHAIRQAVFPLHHIVSSPLVRWTFFFSLLLALPVLLKAQEVSDNGSIEVAPIRSDTTVETIVVDPVAGIRPGDGAGETLSGGEDATMFGREIFNHSPFGKKWEGMEGSDLQVQEERRSPGYPEPLMASDSSKDTSGDGEEEDDHPRLTQEEYMFAGAPRYTLSGKLPYRSTHVQALPTAITTVTVASIVAAIHFYQQDAWWSDRREPFHFFTDWGYAMQADKFGHFYAGYLAAYTGHESLVASGFSHKVASWLGPLLAVGFQTDVEIEDGFSPFGFDPTDQIANLLGPIMYGIRNYVEPLQNVAFKWIYFPTDEYETGVTDGHNTIIVDDYNGQTVWMSLKMGNILPKSLGWPRWLRIAAGYGAVNVDRHDENGVLQQPGRRFMIALDYDLVEMIPEGGAFFNWLIQTLDNFHWPAPALQLSPEVKFYLAFPVHF